MLIGIVAFGTSGYYFVEHMPLFEAFYMTIITISTVGYAEVVPLTQAGRALTIVIIILGITVGAYTIGMLVRAFIEGEMLKIFGRRKVQKQINEDKLARAGASRVVSPHLIGGKRMAQILKRPTVVDFIDIATMGSSLGLMMEEATLGENSDLINKNLIDSNLRKDFGVIIVAIKKWPAT